jgi:hypothetical protein
MNTRTQQHRQQHTDFPLSFIMSSSAPIHKYNQHYLPPCTQTIQQASSFNVAWILSNNLFTGIGINMTCQFLYQIFFISIKIFQLPNATKFLIFVEKKCSQYPIVCFAVSPAASFYQIPADLFVCVCVCVCWDGVGEVQTVGGYVGETRVGITITQLSGYRSLPPAQSWFVSQKVSVHFLTHLYTVKNREGF